MKKLFSSVIQQSDTGGQYSHYLLGISVFFIVLGFRWYFIGTYGVDVPYWDQWDAEATILYKPFLNNRLTFEALFSGHNEHRIILTRLLNLFIFWINEGWSPLLSMVFQATLPSITGGLVAGWYKKDFSNQFSLLSLVLIIITFSTPMNWANLLWGFQSQFYFQVLFAVIAFRLSSKEKWGVINLFVVLGICILASFSLATGFTLPFVIGLTWIYYACTGISKRIHWILFAVVAFIASYALSLLIVHVPGHIPFRADSISSFLISLIKHLGWPFEGVGILFFWIPSFSLLMHFLYKRIKFTSYQIFGFSIFVWVGVLACAASFSRGGGGTGPANRYGDFLILVLPASLFLIDSFVNMNKSMKLQVFSKGLKVLIFFTFWVLSFQSIEDLGASKSSRQGMITTLRHALQQEQQNPGIGLQILRNAVPTVTLPHPSAATVWGILRNPPLNSYLPTSIAIPRALHSQSRVLTEARTVYHSVPPSPSGKEMGTFIGGDQWRGKIESEPVNISKDKVILFLAGYLYPGTLEMDIQALPSGEIQILDEGPEFGTGKGEQWRKVFVTLPENTSHVRVTIRDQSSSVAGWAAIGGITYSSRFEALKEHWSMIGVILIFLGGMLLFAQLRFDGSPIKN